MKKLYFAFTLAILATTVVTAQQQPDNAGFENWDAVGTEDEEPSDWSGMMTGNLCAFCQFGASQRVFQDAGDVHGGTYSARIESTDAAGVTVNGTITTGRVTAPSTTPSQGYNITLTGNADFNHPFTDMPDSLVFWAKYNLTDASDSARVSFVLHDNYGLRDPQDGASASHVVASARTNFQTGGVWQRMSLPFDYSGPSSDPIAYLLATFTASYSPGSGNSNATLWVDDLEFVYNNITSIEAPALAFNVYPNPSLDGRFSVDLPEAGSTLIVSDMMGRTIHSEIGFGKTDVELNSPAGIYLVSVVTQEGNRATQRLVIR